MSDRKAVRKLLGLLTAYKAKLAFVLLCLSVSTGINLCQPLLSRSLMDEGFLKGDFRLLAVVASLSAFLYILDALLQVLKEKQRIDISARAEYALSEQAFSHLLRLRPAYFENRNCTEFLNCIETDIGNMMMVLNNNMFYVISSLFSMIGGLAGLLLINARLTLLVLLFFPLKYAVMQFFARKNRKLTDRYIGSIQEYSAWFGDTLDGIKEVKLFDLYRGKSLCFAEKKKKSIRLNQKMNLMSQWNCAAETVFSQVLTLIIYILGADLVFSLKASLGSIFAFITFSCYVTAPISAVLNIGYMFSGILPSVRRFYEFMDMKEEETKEGEGSVPAFGCLQLQQVSFSYEKGKPVLQDVDLRFPRGSKTALIGKNGAGKTTILNLLVRMCEPQKGKILLDGMDIRQFPLQEYRELFAVVTQQIYLFDDSIINNICLYKEVDPDTLWQIIQDCGLHEFLETVTLGYKVGHDGARLSGGQKQKIALARALVFESPIVIFDEATSNTDLYSELQINSLLRTRLKDKTVILVSHKKEILSLVDQIVFAGEQEVLQGKYQELYAKSQDFREMVELKP